MKAVSGIIAGVFLGIVIAGALISVLVFLGPLDFSPAALSAGAAAPVTETPPTTVKDAPPSPSAASPAAASQAPVPSSTLKRPPSSVVSVPGTSPAPEIKKTVDFSLEISGVSGSGYSRRVSSRLTNRGKADAHNSAVKVEAYYQGSKIKLGGKDYILQSLGTLTAGASQAIDTDLKFSIPDGTKILKNGVDFVITITSDEKSVKINYHYQP
jgi:hypothetical protein